MYSILYPEWPHISKVVVVCGWLRNRLPAKVSPISTVQVALRKYCPVKGRGNGLEIGPTSFDAILRRWLWSTVIMRLAH